MLSLRQMHRIKARCLRRASSGTHLAINLYCQQSYRHNLRHPVCVDTCVREQARHDSSLLRLLARIRKTFFRARRLRQHFEVRHLGCLKFFFVFPNEKRHVLASPKFSLHFPMAIEETAEEPVSRQVALKFCRRYRCRNSVAQSCAIKNPRRKQRGIEDLSLKDLRMRRNKSPAPPVEPPQGAGN